MDCDICGSISKSDAGLHCPACVRASIYPLRIENAKILIEKQALAEKVEDVVTESTKELRKGLGQSNSAQGEQPAKFGYQRVKAEIEDSKERIQRITENANLLMKRIKEYKEEAEEKKQTVERRRNEVKTSRDHISKSYATTIEPMRKQNKKTAGHHDIVYDRIISARVFLCREAASLAGLQQRRKKDEDGNYKETYFLSGSPIVDLRDLNNASPNMINASLTNVSRLLALSCNYLDVRLPAEITLPHRDYPLPTIFGTSSSYSGRSVPFPGTTPSGSPSASRLLDPQENLPRPRPLFLDRKLSVLAKEDPNAYSRFVEGVSLLAWNIAWLCRTQGLAIANNDWEELCAIGRNLWLLLVAPPREPRPSLRRSASSRDAVSTPKDETGRPSRESPRKLSIKNRTQSLSALPASLGVFSHGTTYAFLEGAISPTAKGVETSTSAWKFVRPMLLIDKLKGFLQTELYGLEWEVLDEDEYTQVDGTADDEAILLGGKARDRNGANGGSAAANGVDVHTNPTTTAYNVETRARGTSGWTKLKSRAPL